MWCGVVVVWCPCWIHCSFPHAFWTQMGHWSRIRDLSKNEMDRMESLLYIAFSRQLVYYQVSQRRHSSIENPRSSVAWDLDIVQDMIHASKMGIVDTDICAWGSKDPSNGKFFQQTQRIASTFNVKSLIRRCNKDHEHQHVCGRLRSWLFPLPLCDAWASLAKNHITFLTLR